VIDMNTIQCKALKAVLRNAAACYNVMVNNTTLPEFILKKWRRSVLIFGQWRWKCQIDTTFAMKRVCWVWRNGFGYAYPGGFYKRSWHGS